MANDHDERDELIKDLVAASHDLRMKNEEISVYTESKIAELTKAREDLLLVRQGLETIVQQRNEIQGELDPLKRDHQNLVEAHLAMTDQRDRLRARVLQLETSATYRIGQRMIRLFPFLGDKPTTTK
jgi:uncharacterized protein (DUF3084 family)